MRGIDRLAAVSLTGICSLQFMEGLFNLYQLVAASHI
jgi:hypothetical protein